MSRVVLAGATGLIGTQLLPVLGKLDCQVHVVARQSFVVPDDAVIQHVTQAEQWPDIVKTVRPDVAICCLGTTWKKSGENEAAFRAVDLDLVLSFAGAARNSGATQMIVISSVGASSQSSSFYLRTKGEMEAALRRLDFVRLDILRPGLLTGDRGTDRRTGERLAIAFSPFTDHLLHGAFRRYRSIKAATVANAIAHLVGQNLQGHFIHENRAIETLAG
jgi:uncharacterized protein YbjT (DUF2867 family)